MNIPKTAKRLQKFMEATEREVVDLFLTLPNAVALPYSKGQPIVFVPGTREDRVLLVAHYDTVWSDKKKRTVIQQGTQLLSGDPKQGIGADNRAGCCMLWMMRKLGHSLLIVPDEEVGCLGSGYMAEKYPEYLKDHQFMMQFDRKGYDDLVYYDTETAEFSDFMDDKMPGFTFANGSFTDIVELVPAAGICGVNVSVGFYQEHTNQEWMDVCDFIRCAYVTLNLLRETSLPKFESDYTGRYSTYGGFDVYDNPFDFDPEDDKDSRGDILFVCPHCNTSVTNPTNKELWVYSHPRALCGYCEEEVDVTECTMFEDDLIPQYKGN